MIDPSILRAMLSAGATAEMLVVAVEAAHKAQELRVQLEKEYERNRKREYRMSRMSRGQPQCPGDSGDIPAPSPPMINNSTPPSPPLNKSIKSVLAEPLFDEFWGVYPLKVGKGAARKAYRHALDRGGDAEILAGAKRYAASKPDPKFTAHAWTWLNADRWLDETKPVHFRIPAPKTWAEIKAERENMDSG